MGPASAPARNLPVIDSSARRGLAGFLLSGLAFSLLGAILPAWGFHLSSDYSQIGFFFLSMNGGTLLAVQVGRRALRRLSPRLCLVGATLLAALALLALVFAAPPAGPWLRLGGLFALGSANGILYATCFHLIAPAFGRSPSGTTNLAAVLFCAGSIVTSAVVAGSIEGYRLWLPMAGFSLLAFCFAIWFARGSFPESLATPDRVSASSAFRSPAAILMTLVLVFQFGNEWSVAGWLPILLVQRLGMSPQGALLLLTLFWVSLLLGRLLAQVLLPRFRHSRILLSSAAATTLACLILGVTTSRTGATVAVLLAGGGFAVVYPLLLEVVGRRFSYYHPVYFNGIFTFALTGGLLAPFLFGIVADSAGLGFAMLIPFIGTILVLALLVAIRIEARLNPSE